MMTADQMAANELTARTHALFQADGTLYAARQTGLYQIGADGDARNLYAGWELGNNLPTLAVALDAAADRLLAGIHGGVACSTDSGHNWQAAPFRAPPPLVTCLALLPNGEASIILAGTYEDGIFRSTDGGETWRASNHGLFDHSVNCLAFSPAYADGSVYAGVSSGIYRSQNSGKLWRDMSLPAGDEMVLSLALSPADGALYAGTESHGLLHSADGGANWTRLLGDRGAVNAVALTKDGMTVAQVDDAVLRSNDDGATWAEIVAGGVDCLLLDAENAQLILALSDGGFRREAL